MQDSKSSEQRNPEAESTSFNNSLQELRGLRSQLHHAADYCEATFLNAKQKKAVIENTKEYICRAVVTFVDHIGNVSAKLDNQVSKSNPVSETELRIDCMNQRLAACLQYSHKLTLSRLNWRENFPRYYPRYISPPIQDLGKSKEVSRKRDGSFATVKVKKPEFEADEEVPLFLYTHCHKPSLAKDSSKDTAAKKIEASSPSVIPLRDGLPKLPLARNPSFHFEGNRKLKRTLLNWKTVQSNGILSLIRRSKRAS